MVISSLFGTFQQLYRESEKSLVLTWENESIDRSEFFKLINFLAFLFKQRNLFPNDSVVYYGTNHPVALAIPFACSLLKLTYIAIPDTTLLTTVKKIIADHDVKFSISSEVDSESFKNVYSIWNEFKHRLEQNDFPKRIEEDSGHFFIGFLTSGSTGNSKLVLLKEAHIVANIKASITGHTFQSADSVLAVLNICQSGGLCIQVLPAICAGVPLVLLQKFSMSEFKSEVLKGRTNITLIVPSFLRMLRLSSNWDLELFLHFRLIGIGSARLDAELAEECINKKIPLMSVYGLTEAGPYAICGMIHQIHNGAVNIGKPSDGIEVKLSNGIEGNIFLRGPAVQPLVATNKGLSKSLLDQEGWLDTGDEGQLFNGEYYFINRRTDIANIGGLKVNTLDVESTINTIEGVSACSVFSRQHSVFSEVLVACIETLNPELTRKIISQRCKTLLPRHMVPRNIHIMRELPRSSIGKILKSELKKHYG